MRPVASKLKIAIASGLSTVGAAATGKGASRAAEDIHRTVTNLRIEGFITKPPRRFGLDCIVCLAPQNRQRLASSRSVCSIQNVLLNCSEAICSDDGAHDSDLGLQVAARNGRMGLPPKARLREIPGGRALGAALQQRACRRRASPRRGECPADSPCGSSGAHRGIDGELAGLEQHLSPAGRARRHDVGDEIRRPGMPTGRTARSSRWLDGISGSSVRAGARGRYRAATNFSISALTSSGRSVGGKCPAPDSST